MKRNAIILLNLILGITSSTAADITDSVGVYFRQSHINIDPKYRGNGQRLDSIFSKINSDSALLALRHVYVTGAASPEGSVSINERLSRQRADAIFDLFRQKGVLHSDSATSFNYLGRDWIGLRRMVSEDKDVPYQSDVLALLDNITENGTVNPSDEVKHPLVALKKIHDGKPYRYLYSKLFPELRTSRLVVEYDELYPQMALDVPDLSITDLTLIPDIPSNTHLGSIPVPVKVKECKPFYMGLKTNLLSDVLLIPSVGAEFYVGKNWSVTADWNYGWWDIDRDHDYWRAYGGTIGVRRWFGKKAEEKPLTGHHVGLFAGAVTYDFELGGTGIMGGLPHGTLWERANFISGIEYGYTLPIARRLNIDFTIGFGYMGGKYYKYVPKDGLYVWQSTHRLHWVGPTKAEISLVWLIGCDNYNRHK